MTLPHVDIDRLNGLSAGLVRSLGIEFTACDGETLTARMPVDDRTKQPLGLLHGGATAALAETMGSIGSYLSIDQEKYTAVGMEVTAQHLRSATDGYVHGTATPQHLGRTIHLWEIKVHDDNARLIAICKLTVMIILKKK